MIDRRKFLERCGLGCLVAPLLKDGDPTAGQAPEPAQFRRARQIARTEIRRGRDLGWMCRCEIARIEGGSSWL